MDSKLRTNRTTALHDRSPVCVIAVTIALLLAGGSGVDAEDVVFPDFRGRNEETVFAHAVLHEALQRAPGEYRLVKSSRPEMSNARALVELERKQVDVLWVGTSPNLEKRFRAVYIPITRGLLGHRLFVIHRDEQDVLSRVTSIEGLRELVGGQGTGWTDTAILEQANLDIRTASFDALFQLVNNRRIDYYPLGASEVYGFVRQYRSEYPDIAVEDDLVLVYPFDFLFFVRRDNTQLHDAIEDGMEAMYADGSYIELFRSHPEVKPFFDRGGLDGRRVMRIPNPFSTAEFRAIPDRYWMSIAP